MCGSTIPHGSEDRVMIHKYNSVRCDFSTSDAHTKSCNNPLKTSFHPVTHQTVEIAGNLAHRQISVSHFYLVVYVPVKLNPNLRYAWKAILYTSNNVFGPPLSIPYFPPPTTPTGTRLRRQVSITLKRSGTRQL